jgi:predicted metalloprotease with PDZ domain
MRVSLALLPALAVAAVAGAQEPAPSAPRPDTVITERRDASGRIVERDVRIRSGRPAPDAFTFFRTPARAERARSAIGVRLGEADTSGLRVLEVVADGPAARAGLTTDDRVVAVDGTPLRLAPMDDDDPLLAAVPARRLERAVGRLAPGSTVRLTVARGRAQRTVSVTTAAPAQVAGMSDAPREGDVRTFRFDGGPPAPERLAEAEARMRMLRDSMRERAERRPALGLSVQPTGTARDTLGLFVGAVTSGGPAERAGIVEGDRIAAINGTDVRVPRDEADDAPAGRARAARFTRELQKARPGDEVALRVWRDGQWRSVTVRAGRASEVFRADGVLAGELAPVPLMPFLEGRGTTL